MNNNTFEAIATAAQKNGVSVVGLTLRLCDVREPGFYYTPSNQIEHQRLAHFDGVSWRFVGDSGKFSARMLEQTPVYGPLHFEQGLISEDSVEQNTWPNEGDEFTVFVDVREAFGELDGFVLNPPPVLAAMLRHYGGDEFKMAEEYFGQDFLPTAPGTYRMKLRMCVEPAYQIDGDEWSDDEPFLEILNVERVNFEPVPVGTGGVVVPL